MGIKQENIKRILVVRFSSIGDIVLTTPVLRCIKKQYPDVELHYFTKKGFAGMMEANPYVDKVHILGEQLSESINALRALQFDVLIDLHHNLRTLRVKRALQVKHTYSFPKLNIEKWLYVRLKWNKMPPISIVQRYLEAAKPIGVEDDGQGLDFFIPEEQEVDLGLLPSSHQQGYVAAVVGGSFATKQFPANRWKALIARLAQPIVLLGGPEDNELAAQIAAEFPNQVFNACGKFKLMQSADLVRKARVVISNDTGLMHIAAAFQKPLVSLWGNTTPWLGMYPYYGGHTLNDDMSALSFIAENKHLSCRPCSKIGYNSCPKKHFKCMNDIELDGIIAAVGRFWESGTQV